MNKLFMFLTSSGGDSNNTDKFTDTMKNMVKSPVFYIVIGAIVLLIILVYLLKRFVTPSKDVAKIVVRHGSIYKIIDENSQKYYMVPFKDGLVASISLSEREMISDKLFINNGPDALYKINYTLSYQVSDVAKYFPVRDNFQNLVVVKINDSLREYADEGNALHIVKDYREYTKDILKIIDMSSGKRLDDGYRGVHVYYQIDNYHYQIEIQFNTLFDRQMNNWLHDYVYKKNYPLALGQQLRAAYENGRITDLHSFEVILNDLLSCEKQS